MAQYHNFKLIKTMGGKMRTIRIIGQPERPKEYLYRCDNCDTEIKIKAYMTNEAFNRDFHQIYPQVLCLNENDRINRRV